MNTTNKNAANPTVNPIIKDNEDYGLSSIIKGEELLELSS